MLSFKASFKYGRASAVFVTLLSLFDATVLAQGFNVSTVALATRQAWCSSQISNCAQICESAGSDVQDTENTCNTNTLAITCTCVNGFSPDMASYTNTIPYFICQQVYANCIDQNPNDAAAQATCEQEQKTFCNGGSTADITSVYHITQTASNGSKKTSAITLTLIEQAAATPTTTTSSSKSSSSSNKSSSSSKATSSSSTRSASPNGSATRTASPKASSKAGISTGALAAAIVVPIVGVALIAIGLVTFMFRKRRARRAAKVDEPTGFEKAELHGEPMKLPEMPVQERFEMEGEGIPAEVRANEEAAYEMGSSSPARDAHTP